jgi:DNA-binding NarL/FixJ family response regulator
MHNSYQDTRFVLLLDSYDRRIVVSAIRAGACGLFCRTSQPFRALCRCITVVHDGQFWANTEQIGYIVEALTNPSSRIVNARGENLLTTREDQIVDLVAEGIANREIAQELGIKENTVKKSLLRIYDKLGISNRVELVVYTLTQRGGDRKVQDPSAMSAPDSAPAAVGSLDRDTVRILDTDGSLSQVPRLD